jgi:hypothetical protein
LWELQDVQSMLQGIALCIDDSNYSLLLVISLKDM